MFSTYQKTYGSNGEITFIFDFIFDFIVDFLVPCRAVREEDEGPYICRASNEGGYNEELVWILLQRMSHVLRQF